MIHMSLFLSFCQLFSLPTDDCTLPLDKTANYRYGNIKSDHESLGVLFPALVFACVLLIIIWSSLHMCCRQSGTENSNFTGPQVLTSMIVCHDDNGLYEYNLVLRAGCPTANFDMQRGYIEVAVLGPEDVVQGQPVRFKCSLLPDRVCGEMILQIIRMSVMPPIAGLQLHHGDPNGSIFFYEAVLIDTFDNSVVEILRFNTYLTNRPTIYRGTKCNPDEPDPLDGLYPELPWADWTPIECAIIASFFIMLTGSVVLVFEYYNIFPVNRQQEGSLYRSLLAVCFTLLIEFPLFAAVIFIYKYIFKRNMTTQAYSVNSNTQYWKLACRLFLIIFLVATIVLFAIFVQLGSAISVIKSLYWWSSTLIITICLLGSWFSVHGCTGFFERFFESGDVQQEFLLKNLVKDAGPKSTKAGLRATTFFNSILENKTSKLSDKMNTDLTYGPKLFNPKLKRKGKAGKVIMKTKATKRLRPKNTTNFSKRKKQLAQKLYESSNSFSSRKSKNTRKTLQTVKTKKKKVNKSC